MGRRQKALPFLNGSFLKALFSLKGVGGYLFQEKATVWGKTTQTAHVWEDIWDLVRGRWKGEAFGNHLCRLSWTKLIKLELAASTWISPVAGPFLVTHPYGFCTKVFDTDTFFLVSGASYSSRTLTHISSLLSALSLCSIIWDGISRVFSLRRSSE